MTRTAAVLTAAALGACTASGWERMQAEFPEVRANCGLSGTYLERDRRDPRLLHLVFRHRSNMALQARRDGRVACAQLWAEEQGFRLTTAPDDGRLMPGRSDICSILIIGRTAKAPPGRGI